MTPRHVKRVRNYLTHAILFNYLSRFSSILLALGLLAGIGMYVGGRWSFYNPPYGHPVMIFHIVQATLFLLLVASWGWPRLRHPATPQEIAQHLEKADPKLNDCLSSALDFSAPDPLQEECLQISTGILPAFFEDTFLRVRSKRRWRRVVPLSFWVLLALSVLFAAFLLNISRFEPFTSGDIWQLYRTNFLANPYRPLHTLDVQPGFDEILKGDSLRIQATLSGPGDHDATIRYSMAGFPEETAAMKTRAIGSNLFEFDFENMQSDLTYQVEAGPLTTGLYTVKVRIPPELTHIQLTYKYPEFMDRNIELMPPGEGAARAPVGTTVEVTTRWNQAMDKIFLQVNDEEKVPVRRRSSSWKQSFVLENAGRYVLSGSSQEGVPIREGLEFPIQGIEDLPPEIEWVWPKENIDYSNKFPRKKLPLKYRVKDDYGLESIYLYAGAPGRATQSYAVANLDGKVRAHSSVFPFDLDPWKKEPVVRVYFVANDNHPVARNQSPTETRRFYIMPPGTFSEEEDLDGPEVNTNPYELTSLELYHLIKLQRVQNDTMHENSTLDESGVAIWSGSQSAIIDKTARTALRVSVRAQQVKYGDGEDVSSSQGDATGELKDLPSRLTGVVVRLVGNTSRLEGLRSGSLEEGNTAIDFQLRQEDAGNKGRGRRSREEGERALRELEEAFRELTGEDPPTPAEEIEEEDSVDEGEGEGEGKEEEEDESEEGEDGEGEEEEDRGFEDAESEKIVKTIEDEEEDVTGGPSLPTNEYAPSAYTLDPDSVHLDSSFNRLLQKVVQENVKGLDMAEYGNQPVPPEYRDIVAQYNEVLLGK
jgi:uncharacterized protein DUF4175